MTVLYAKYSQSCREVDRPDRQHARTYVPRYDGRDLRKSRRNLFFEKLPFHREAFSIRVLYISNHINLEGLTQGRIVELFQGILGDTLHTVFCACV